MDILSIAYAVIRDVKSPCTAGELLPVLAYFPSVKGHEVVVHFNVYTDSDHNLNIYTCAQHDHNTPAAHARGVIML